jgi:hypothetical protein
MLTRPVAAALVDLVTRPASGYTCPIAGPDELWMGDMAKRTARGDRELVLTMRPRVAFSSCGGRG